MKFLKIIQSVHGNYNDSYDDKFVKCGRLSEMKSIPEMPGVYILYSPVQEFVYPWKMSNVFYIGMDGVNLNSRVYETHKKYTADVMENKRKGYSIYYPVYEYAAAYEGHCMYYQCTNEKSSEIEGELLARFAILHGGIPVGNRRHDNKFWSRFEI